MPVLNCPMWLTPFPTCRGYNHPLAAHPLHWPLQPKCAHYLAEDDNCHNTWWCPECYSNILHRVRNVRVQFPSRNTNQWKVKCNSVQSVLEPSSQQRGIFTSYSSVHTKYSLSPCKIEQSLTVRTFLPPHDEVQFRHWLKFMEIIDNALSNVFISCRVQLKSAERDFFNTSVQFRTERSFNSVRHRKE
jgi:hypothetical protein